MPSNPLQLFKVTMISLKQDNRDAENCFGRACLNTRVKDRRKPFFLFQEMSFSLSCVSDSFSLASNDDPNSLRETMSTKVFLVPQHQRLLIIEHR